MPPPAWQHSANSPAAVAPDPLAVLDLSWRDEEMGGDLNAGEHDDAELQAQLEAAAASRYDPAIAAAAGEGPGPPGAGAIAAAPLLQLTTGRSSLNAFGAQRTARKRGAPYEGPSDAPDEVTRREMLAALADADQVYDATGSEDGDGNEPGLGGLGADSESTAV